MQGSSEPVSVVDGRRVIVLCSNNYLGLTTHAKLYERGVFVVPIVFPMVAQGLAHIRVQMHAKLTMEEPDKVIEALEEIGKELEIIYPPFFVDGLSELRKPLVWASLKRFKRPIQKTRIETGIGRWVELA